MLQCISQNEIHFMCFRSWLSYQLAHHQFNFENIFGGWNVFHPYASLDFKGVS